MFDADHNDMKCRLCIDYHARSGKQDNLKQKHLFVTGCTNFRTSTIVDHEKSQMHEYAVSLSLAARAPEKTPAYKSLLAINQHNRKIISYKFRNVHAVIKHNRPFSDYVWLNQLDAAKGIDVTCTDTYNNRQAATTFIENIGEIQRQKLVQDVSNIKFFSITMDGSTDDGTVEQETLCLKWCNKGIISNRFICIGEPESTTSNDLYNFVINELQANTLYISMDKCIGFGSDGASNMMGKKKGLVVLLKKDYPQIIGVHCLCHRLELSFKDALKKNAVYDRLVTMLLGIYYFYKNSPLQRKTLRKTFDASIFVIIMII